MYVMRGKPMPSRITVAVCVPVAGVGGIGRPLSGGTWFLAISGILVFCLGMPVSAAVVIRCDSDGFCFGRGFSRELARAPGFPSTPYWSCIDVSGVFHPH